VVSKDVVCNLKTYEVKEVYIHTFRISAVQEDDSSPLLPCLLSLWKSAPASVYFIETRMGPISMPKRNPRPSRESKPDP
jgi:hypothetical protein